MSEYIVRIPPDMPYEIRAELNAWYVESEPIVRCRDCRFADWDITAWWCTRNKHYPFEIGKLRGYGERSHLDGFCAWGERREQ